MTTPIDTTKPNMARRYDYWLGGKVGRLPWASQWRWSPARAARAGAGTCPSGDRGQLPQESGG